MIHQLPPKPTLSGVTAAVVGVVLQPGARLWDRCYHFRRFYGRRELVRSALSTAAFVALYKFKTEVLWVVLGGGVTGLVKTILFG